MNKTGSPYIHPSDSPDSGVGGKLRMSVAAGAASGVDITVAGIKPEDMVTHVHEFTGVDRTSDVMAIKAGAIQLSGATTSGAKLQVGWLDRLPG